MIEPPGQPGIAFDFSSKTTKEDAYGFEVTQLIFQVPSPRRRVGEFTNVPVGALESLLPGSELRI